jgi:intron-binding protein aquarius
VRLAKTHWLDAANVRKVKHDVIKKDIWDPLEAESFSFRSLLILENLNILEKFAQLTFVHVRLNLLSFEQVSLADIHRRRLKLSCPALSIDCERQAERAFANMG